MFYQFLELKMGKLMFGFVNELCFSWAAFNIIFLVFLVF